MSADLAAQLSVVGDVVGRFRLTSLQPALRACETLAGADAPLDVAVLGQFKSGKSSLLNAVLGEAVFPVGALPVTAVITRASAGPERVIRVTHLDGSIEAIAHDRLTEFVTETGNPGNCRQVAAADVFTPAMSGWQGVRLVDTPGLGSVFAHNTEATRAWMPNMAVALVTVSAERPLSDEDRQLVAEARQTAPRVVVVLTKVDLLTDAERLEIMAFLERALRESFGSDVSVLPFSCRAEPEKWVRQLREVVLVPVAADVARERQAALALKCAALVRSCRSYLKIGLQAADRLDSDREQLRAAVFDESVNAELIGDELRLAEQRVCGLTRAAFEKLFSEEKVKVEQQVGSALAVESPTWQGNLAQQVQRYEAWLKDRLLSELTPLSREATPLAASLLGEAEDRFRRIVGAFRDRLSRNISEAIGVTVSPASWEIKRPQLSVIPVAVGRAFMTSWDLLWWLLPMWLVGGLFRRHILGRVSWEVEKNLTRLTGDWSRTVNTAVSDLRMQATDWVDAELATLDQLLGRQAVGATVFREALERLEDGMTDENNRQPV